MKYRTSYLYECVFLSDSIERYVFVVADSFGLAASLAYSIADTWDDKDSLELARIYLNKKVTISA